MQSLWMLAASFLFAVMAACTKAGASEFGTFELVFYRSLFGVICIAFWVWKTGRSLHTPLLGAHLLRSFLGTFAITVWFFVIGLLPLGTAMTLNYTSPLYMAAFITIGALRRRESIRPGLLASIASGFIGLTLVLRPEFREGDALPCLIGLSAGFLAALAYVQVKQLTRMNEPEWRIVFYFSLVGTIAALVGHFAYEGQLTPITSTNIWALLGIAVSGVLAQLSLTRAWGGGNLLLTSSLQFSAIVFAAIIGFFVFDEPISVFSGLGIALIVGSGLTATLETKRKLRTSIPQKSSVKSSTKG